MFYLLLLFKCVWTLQSDAILIQVLISRALCLVFIIKDCLDEGQKICKPKTQTPFAVCALKARHRRIITGTQVLNRMLDLYALLKFLWCSPTDGFNVSEYCRKYKQYNLCSAFTYLLCFLCFMQTVNI
jgi:hypothetical protein